MSKNQHPPKYQPFTVQVDSGGKQSTTSVGARPRVSGVYIYLLPVCCPPVVFSCAPVYIPHGGAVGGKRKERRKNNTWREEAVFDTV